MRRMVFLAPGKLEWREAPDPEIEGPDEAIVSPTVMGRCDLDALYLAGRVPLAAGEPIGHEIIGTVVDLGETAARRFRIGQTVIVTAQIACGSCGCCLAGLTGRCERVPFGASYGMGRAGGYGGAVGERVRVPFAGGMMVPLPSGCRPETMIGLADMSADAWRAVGPPLAARPGGSVLVVGGMVPVIGIFATGLARALGAGRVVYVDADASRRDAAAAYGADVAEHVEAVGSGFDVVVDAAGDAARLVLAVRACAPEAILTSVAPPFVPPDLPMAEMYWKGLTYTIGRPNCRPGCEHALHAWASRGFDPSIVGPKLFAFDDAPEAWIDLAIYVAVTR